METKMNLSIFGLKNIPYLKEGDGIEKLIEESIKTSEFFIEDNDVLCIASKVVSVAEGQVMSLNEIQVSDVAKEIHRNIPRKDPRIIEIMLNLVNRDLSRFDIKKNYIGCHPLRKTEVIDSQGETIKFQEETLCDMIAACAGLVMVQRGIGIPAVIVKGLEYEWSKTSNIKEAINEGSY